MSVGIGRTLIAVCVLSGPLLLTGAGPDRIAQPRSSGAPFAGGAAEGASVLVEAFVIEVNLPALAKGGVSPIGRRPHAVTVADILACLDGGQARIVGGQKIATQPNDATVAVQTKRTTYLQRGTAPSQVARSPYASGAEFTVSAHPVSETALSVRFTFENSRLSPKQAEEEIPSEIESWNCSGAAVLDLGEPQIVGAGQAGETAVFLLLVADTRN